MKKNRGLMRRCLLFLAFGLLAGLLCGMSASAATYNLPSANNPYSTPAGQHYCKITVKKSGVLGIEAYGVTSSGTKTRMKIGLLNSKKQRLETLYHNMTGSNSYKVYYGVKAGTYYIAAKKYSDSDAVSRFYFKYSTSAVTEKSGASKAKSKPVSQNETRYGTLRIGESGSVSDWYKFRVVSKKKVSLAVKPWTNGGNVIVEVYCPRLNKSYTYVCTSGKTRTFNYKLNSGNAITAMFYVRVYRQKNDANISGYYALKWS